MCIHSHPFAQVRWTLDGLVHDTLASLGNAHPPRTIGGGDLGYLATTLKGNIYAALVVQDGNAPVESSDRWALIVGDLAVGTLVSCFILVLGAGLRIRKGFIRRPRPLDTRFQLAFQPTLCTPACTTSIHGKSRVASKRRLHSVLST